jgi:A/G-specific adenine glycosylase
LALKGNLHEPTFRRAVESELGALLSRHSPGTFNQSLMELGQTACSPRAPHCEACPLRKWCRAFRVGNPEFFPEPRPRRATESHYLAAALIRRGSSVALIRGLDDGLLGDLWNFPSALGRSHQESLDRLRIKLCGLTGGPVTIGRPIAELNHGITFRSIRVQIYPARITNVWHSFRWVDLAHLQKAAVSQLARKIASQLPQAETSLRNHEV